MIKAAIIDSREPDSIKSIRFDGALTTVSKLDYGDMWVSTDDGQLLCVERKTPSDLLGSIKDKRIFQQCAGMRDKTPWAYVVVTGTLNCDNEGKVIANGRKTGWQWSSVQGALLSVQELGVNIAYSQNDSEYPYTIKNIANRSRSTEKLLQPTVQPRLMSPGEIVLSSLPGIGEDKAKLLLDEFNGCAADAIAWLTWLDTTYTVAGVSTGTKQKVRSALGLTDGWHLTKEC